MCISRLGLGHGVQELRGEGHHLHARGGAELLPDARVGARAGRVPARQLPTNLHTAQHYELFSGPSGLFMNQTDSTNFHICMHYVVFMIAFLCVQLYDGPRPQAPAPPQ